MDRILSTPRPANQKVIAHRPASPTDIQAIDKRGRYKRPFDIAVLAIGHLLLFPLWVALWVAVPLAIWLGDKGPIFYTQVRLGRHAKPFRVVKFRTMITDAEAQTGPVWAADDDWRITAVGRVLRRLRLDEMPQVINIWKGEMSLVGPRPERPELAEEFTRRIPDFPSRLRVRPGVAGLAQVRGRYATRPRDKLRYDKKYIQVVSPLLDLKLLILSLWIAIRGRSHSTG